MNLKQILFAGAVAGAALMLPSISRAGIIGSPHDFSGESWNVKPGDHNSVCGTCHTPHHADSSIVPLWAHATTAQTFTMYNTANVVGVLKDSASSLQATIDNQPASASKACLSCHDGTVAINTYGGSTWGSASVTITNTARIVGADQANGPSAGPNDLTHTHPISLAYDSALSVADKFIFDPDANNVLTPVSGTFNSSGNLSINSFLLGGTHRLECSSCHDVHNQVGSPYDFNNNPNLVKIVGVDAQNNGSLLCRSCHNK